MKYPLTISFKRIALANKLSVTDSSNEVLMYANQKLMKLREAIKIHPSSKSSELLYEINADRVIDFRAAYTISNQKGTNIGSIRRKGARSMFKASYELYDKNNNLYGHINEESAMLRFVDSLFSALPYVGLLSGYLLHPKYILSTTDNQQLIKIKKEPAFFESKFTISNLASTDEYDENLIATSILMMLILERERG